MSVIAKQRKGRSKRGIGLKCYTKKKELEGRTFFSVAQYLNRELVFLVVAIYVSHGIRHTYALGILRTSNQLFGEASI